jgi:O-antigen ligase
MSCRVGQTRNCCQIPFRSRKLGPMLGRRIFGLILFFWVAIHTAQSLMDLADFLLVITAIFIAFREGEFRNLLTSVRIYFLWPIWIGALMLGFVYGAPVEAKVAAKNLWEFRWMFSFLCYVYLFKKVPWETSHTSGFVKSLILALLFVSVLDMALFFINYHLDPRAGGLFHHSMPFAHTMGPAALFLLFAGFRMAGPSSESRDRSSFIWRGIFALTPLLAMGLVILTMTRGVWLGCVVALLVGSLFMGVKFFAKTSFVLIFSMLLLFIGSEKVQKRVLSQSYAASQSNNERLLYWESNFEIFKDYPLFGIGYSQNNVHVEEYLKKRGVDWLIGGHAHNQYLHFLAGTGILGLSCYLFFLFYLLKSGLVALFKMSKSSPQYCLLLGAWTGMLCFCIGSLTESNFSIAKNRFVFLFLAAISVSIVARSGISNHKSKLFIDGP